MALLYNPGRFMPGDELDFRAASWLIGWPDGPWCMHDVQPGNTVYLVDVVDQRIVWETRVTQSFAVPYEAVGDLAAEVERRWGLEVEIGTLPAAGYCVGWRAQPIARLDRTLAPDPDTTSIDDAFLDGFQMTCDQSPTFLRRWGLRDEGTTWCTGRPRLGWFGAG